TGANIHDSQVFGQLLEQVIEKVGRPTAVAVDAGYKTPANAKILLDKEIRPVMPYTRPRTKDGFFKKYEYVYDEHYDCYICPNNQTLEYRTTTREGYRQYASKPEICKTCPFLEKCTQSKDHTKFIHRHIWEHYVEGVDHLRHTDINRNIYDKRKETIERVFADGKEKHGMRWTTLRGLEKLSMQAMLTFAAMNLKKMANWTWKSPCPA
ncbi:transposase, partial [Ureibacillus thermophilus]|uniref:transposase n=1 Tax=Ureibacillus thermophilus TaxID=367743 RepID=UPI00361604B9